MRILLHVMFCVGFRARSHVSVRYRSRVLVHSAGTHIVVLSKYCITLINY